MVAPVGLDRRPSARPRGFEVGFAWGGHVCVAFLDEARHQEGGEGADCRGCDIDYSPEASNQVILSRMA